MKLLTFLLLFAFYLRSEPCTNCTSTGAYDFRILNSKAPDAVMSFGPRMVFTIPVPNGTYEVALRFMEPNRFYVGGRVFNVSVNDTPMLWNFDIFAAAGTNPTSRVMVHVVSEGKLVIVLSSATGSAVVSSITVTPMYSTYTIPLIMPTATVPGVALSIPARFWPDGTRKLVAVPLVKPKPVPAGFNPDGTRKASATLRR